MTTTELKHYANIYSLSQQGVWLNQINWRSIYLAIVDGPGLGSRWLGNIILVDPQSDQMSQAQQFGTYIHQLRHAYQSKNQGLVVYALKNLLKLNQPQAQKYGNDAISWYGDQKCLEIREAHQNRLNASHRSNK